MACEVQPHEAAYPVSSEIQGVQCGWSSNVSSCGSRGGGAAFDVAETMEMAWKAAIAINVRRVGMG